jgi:hypothetical protein
MDVGAPAVVAAIHDAIGAWIPNLPATPERVLAALGATGEPPLPAWSEPAAPAAFPAASADDASAAGTLTEMPLRAPEPADDVPPAPPGEQVLGPDDDR